MDKYSCAEWDVPNSNTSLEYLSDNTEESIRNLHCKSDISSDTNLNINTNTCYSGFGFRVVHPLTLHSIGVRMEILESVDNLFVIFKDADEVFENINIKREMCSNMTQNFCFINLQQKFYLPKDFEGMLALDKDVSLNSSNEVCHWTSNGCFQFTFGMIGNHYEKYQENECSYVIANFSIADKVALKYHLKEKPLRYRSWLKEEDAASNQFFEEFKNYEDVVYLPYIVDVYRSLPLKVVEVIKWAHRNHPTSYVLKVDDDTHVNVPLLMEWLKREITDHRKLSIWSHFYHQRSVPLFGKWADFEFQSITYPPFPSGSGYLLSDRLIYLLSMQSPFLRPFQGEDISVGIWTQILQLGQETVDKINVPCWLPSEACNQSFLIPDLTPEMMMEENLTRIAL